MSSARSDPIPPGTADAALRAAAEERIAVDPVKRLKRRMRSTVSTRPALYLPLRRRRRPDSVAGPETEFILEGFPRCGNTWTEMALREAARRPLRMAHHAHAAAHVIYGLRRSIPVLVLYRAPDAAVRSLLAMGEKNLSARDAYREYVRFYRTVLALPRDHLSYASFEDVTRQIDRVIAHLATRFGLPVAPFDGNDPARRAAIFARMDHRAALVRPDLPAGSRSNPTHHDALQAACKQAAQAQIARLQDDPLRRQAQMLYSQLQSDIT